MVCNGHYEAASAPELPGADVFPGRIEHSHSYKTNDKYEGLRVVVLGSG